MPSNVNTVASRVHSGLHTTLTGCDVKQFAQAREAGQSDEKIAYKINTIKIQ
ncbi:hypothetical protein ACJ2_31390 [Pantoea sp. QMID2]|nr:hypothetical protein ACJ3_35000 [Pantoea sp. QMID3]GME44242.1 hypothetical protein ACJ1_34800 [Pantoea sp. QMID1]GME58868.1 hypothetical protein ACJ4_31310 [Pantoea sp. QMID4]GME60268.1 hypothetical protein ACJ2_31390 [Pantoea sp. QMID2]